VSRIDDLIAEHIPAGVRFEVLGDIAELVRGNGMPKADFTDTGIGAIHYGQIYTRYGVWATSTLSFVAQETAERLAKVNHGDIIITNTSENLADVGKAVAWLGSEQIVTGGHATVIRHGEDPKYLAYWFQSKSFRAQKTALATGTKVIDISAKQLSKIRLPLPPLEVQREIVRILDNFTELEAELEARRKQYAHYRSQVFAGVDARRVPLADLGKWTGGVTPSTSESRYWEAGTIPWLASMDVSASGGHEIRGRVTQAAIDETSLRVVPAPTVAVVMRSNILRRVLPIGRIEVDVSVNQDIRLLAPGEGVDADYVYLALLAASEDIRVACVRTDGSMAAVSSGDFFAWEIPLPSLTEQAVSGG